MNHAYLATVALKAIQELDSAQAEIKARSEQQERDVRDLCAFSVCVLCVLCVYVSLCLSVLRACVLVSVRVTVFCK